MKKWILIAALLFSIVGINSVQASSLFKSDVVVKNKEEIVKLSDDQIVNEYLDVLVDIDAIKTYHNTEGFMPSDYKFYKDLVRYRLQLLLEIHRRNIEIPQFDRYGM